MSWWMYGKDKSGKGAVWQVDIEPMSVIFLVGLAFALFVPSLLRGPMAVFEDGIRFLAAGVACLIASKTSLFRRGIWVSFGSGSMTTWWARLYKLGYVLMGIGVFLVIVAYGSAS